MGAPGVGREINLGMALPARPGCREPMPKVSPVRPDARAMAKAKHVDAGPSLSEGGYSPMTQGR
jgi:hypothetical protein